MSEQQRILVLITDITSTIQQAEANASWGWLTDEHRLKSAHNKCKELTARLLRLHPELDDLAVTIKE